jgi:hypothetical protein
MTAITATASAYSLVFERRGGLSVGLLIKMSVAMKDPKALASVVEICRM